MNGARTTYFNKGSGIHTVSMSVVNEYHRDNLSLSMRGHLPTISQTHIPGAVCLDAQEWVPSGESVAAEMAYAQQQILAESGVGLPPTFPLDENHRHNLCASYLLGTALCYVYSWKTGEGYLAIKDALVYDAARQNFGIPAPSKSVAEVLHTPTVEELTSGKFKVARINQENPTRWTVAARQCDLGPKSDAAIFPAYAVENYVQVVLRALAAGAYVIRFADGDGVERVMTTTLNGDMLTRLYCGNVNHAAQVWQGVRSKAGFADLILPDMGCGGDLVTVNALSISRTKKVS